MSCLSCAAAFAATASFLAALPAVAVAAAEPGGNRALTIEYDGPHFDVSSHMRTDAGETGENLYMSGSGTGEFHLYRGGGFGSVVITNPSSGPLAPGVYAASSGGPRPAEAAGVYNGMCPSGQQGTLTVHEASLRPDVPPDVFSATYEGTCGPGRVRIQARWNSTGDYDALAISPNRLDLNNPAWHVGQAAPPAPFTIVNTGSRPRSLAAATAGGPAAADWTFDSAACTASPLAVGASCELSGTFAPKAAGQRDAILKVGDRQIALRGYGLTAPGTPVVTALPTIGRIRLTWAPVDSGGPGSVSYLVLRGSSTLAQVTAPQYDVRLDTLPRDGALTFRVKAIGPGGHGAPSAPVTPAWPDTHLTFVDPDVITLAQPGDPARRLRTTQTGAIEPAISPDGTRHVFVVKTSGGDHLWSGSTDLYGGAAPLTWGATKDRQPAWSPDGTMLAFTRDDASGFGLRVRWMAGAGRIVGVPFGGGASSPTWLPSGRELVVVRHGPTPYVEILSLDGGRQKVAGTDGAIQAAVSPDGARIAFVHRGAGMRTTIRVVRIGGGTPVTVASLGGYAQNPSWTPDGRLLYFDSAPLVDPEETRGNADLYVVDPVGGAPRNLTGTPDRNETHPVVAHIRPAPRPAQPRTAVDFTGDGRADPAVFRQLEGTWYVRGMPALRWGQLGDVPVAGDYNGDRRADLAVYRPSNGAWYVRGVGTFVYGQPGDVPVPADYNGDRRVDIAIFRPSTGMWHVRLGPSWQYGKVGDVPVPADHTGDGRAEPAVYRPSTAQWYVLGLGTFQYGYLGAVPAPADYDGDRKADIVVFDPYDGHWAFAGRPAVRYGAFADVPVPGDFNGDRKADLAVFRPSTGTWYVRGVATLAYGRRGDEPV